jgi:hypothetical protein
MNPKQLKDILRQIEALKTPDTSAEFQAGVDAAHGVVNAIVQEAFDRERMQKLEAELQELRSRYQTDNQPAPKRRGRRPKQTTPQNQEFETVAGA